MSIDAQKCSFNKTSSGDAGRPPNQLLLIKLFPFGCPVGVCIILVFLFNLVGRVWIFFLWSEAYCRQNERVYLFKLQTSA